MMAATQDLELMGTQAEVKMELEDPKAQLESAKESPVTKFNKTEDRISGFEEKVDDLYKIALTS